ncbi:2-dehydro-3-deoxygalactonokinase [Algicella marina]|uniref:2-keto-3-deoxy-galactonokinase n=1 Tax=Algicella marina TaxID=2683284 RepID=A0A6P1T606_9RHOB|nr:2-dehydro-3-deoxygalactonokinase [Algicella marina]QHQ37120.1 2-keto-3-deoxy-galactonokinase [Algicella marina]
MKADWIAVDWGTSNLRAWGMDAGGAVLAEAVSEDGMGGLEPGGFEPALLELVEPWLGPGVTDVIACGMVGARQGWVEAPYAKVPVAALGDGLTLAPVRDGRLRVQILSGISQDNPADVMRGEETQIAGYLAEQPKYSGVIVLPGTHTKWVQIADGEIFHFGTFMTGELYALLSRQSVLRHSVAQGGGAAFVEAFEAAMARPEALAARLFGLRAEHLLAGTDKAVLGARLSGMLLGLEFAAARPYWLGQQVVLMAAEPLLGLYREAMGVVGLMPEVAEPDACVLAGLRAARLAGLEGKGVT